MGRGIRILLTLACVLAGGQALAQTKPGVPPKKVAVAQPGAMSTQEIQARREFLFNAMLQKPDNLDAAFEYAALSAQVGDLEAAISTLERMLIFAPGLPRLQLELGVLYYRMAAFETARSYFEAAIAAPNVPPEVRSRVEQYLAGIDDAADPTRFAGQIRAGIRYQTNANRAPVDSIIFLDGLPFTLDANSLGSPDGNVYATGVFHVSHDLESQGDTLEVDLITYGSKQFEQEELDVGLAELTIGPAFDMGRFGIDNAALGIYGIGSGVLLAEDFYSAGIGAGTRFVIRPNPATYLTAALEYRHKDYHDSESSPTASLRNGDELSTFGTATYVLSPTIAALRQRLSAAGLGRRRLSLLSGGRLHGRPALFLRLAGRRRHAALDRRAQYGRAVPQLRRPRPDDRSDVRREGLGSIHRRRAHRACEARRRAHHRVGIPLRRFELRHAQIRQFLYLVQRREELLRRRNARGQGSRAYRNRE